MSSSIALQSAPGSALRNPGGSLTNRQRSAPRARRTGALADRIAMHIESLVPQGRAECLDIGTGDLTLAEAVDEQLLRTHWHSIDVNAAAAGPSNDDRWSQWGRFDGRRIPYGDDEFDVAVICDVLHRVPDAAPRLLAEAARVARYVLVKDRFHSGIGAAPYFTQETFGRLVAEQGLVITALDCGLDRHDERHAVGALRRDWQFIAVLRRS